MSDESTAAYPLAERIPKEQLDSEAELLASLGAKPLHVRIATLLRLGGPGFMGAALTLGAGTLTAAMLSGAQFGYKMLWISWVAIGSGLFMMAAMARFTTRGQFRIIAIQSRRHGAFVGRGLTAFLGLVCVAVAFNFGQVALGTHLMESIGETANIPFPQEINWLLYGLVTAWIALSYGRGGRKGVAFVETFMKSSLLLMLICFAACLVVVGIDWQAALRGFFVPWLPAGQRGIDLFIASSAAAVGVMDWVFFHYAGLAKGWGPRHEGLARVDMIAGLAVPFLVINFVVVAVFAGTLFGTQDAAPTSARELAAALAPLLGETGANYAFLLGFLAVPITTTVAMSIACAVGVHEMMRWDPDVRSWRWKASILLPQVGLVAAFAPSPLLLIIVIAAALALTNNIVSWSFFLLLNDREVLGEYRSQSYMWNFGILIQVTLLNAIAILWVLNRFGLWGAS